MEMSTRGRAWRVKLSDGSIIEVFAIKLVVTDPGALMFIDFDREPRRVIREWVECEELLKRGQR